MTHRDEGDVLEPEVRDRVDRMVWCAVATVDTRGRPWMRALHPIREGCTCWIRMRRNSTESLHLARNPHVSLAYSSDPARPVYIEAAASWEDHAATKQHVRDLFLHTPEPLGYNPAVSFIAVGYPNLGVLRIESRKIGMATLAADPWHEIWRAPRA